MAHRTTLHTLPAEIIEICFFAGDFADWRSLRLVCRSIYCDLNNWAARKLAAEKVTLPATLAAQLMIVDDTRCYDDMSMYCLLYGRRQKFPERRYGVRVHYCTLEDAMFIALQSQFTPRLQLRLMRRFIAFFQIQRKYPTLLIKHWHFQGRHLPALLFEGKWLPACECRSCCCDRKNFGLRAAALRLQTVALRRDVRSAQCC